MLASTDASNKFREYLDKDYSGYTGDASSSPIRVEADAITMWKAALGILFDGVVPVSTTVNEAKDAFAAAATGMGVTPAIFVAGLNAFCNALGGGMAGYTATPPVFTPADLMLATPAVTGEAGCVEIIGKIVAKSITGTATLTVPPFTVVNWS